VVTDRSGDDDRTFTCDDDRLDSELLDLLRSIALATVNTTTHTHTHTRTRTHTHTHTPAVLRHSQRADILRQGTRPTYLTNTFLAQRAFSVAGLELTPGFYPSRIQRAAQTVLEGYTQGDSDVISILPT